MGGGRDGAAAGGAGTVGGVIAGGVASGGVKSGGGDVGIGVGLVNERAADGTNGLVVVDELVVVDGLSMPGTVVISKSKPKLVETQREYCSLHVPTIQQRPSRTPVQMVPGHAPNPAQIGMSPRVVVHVSPRGQQPLPSSHRNSLNPQLSTI